MFVYPQGHVGCSPCVSSSRTCGLFVSGRHSVPPIVLARFLPFRPKCSAVCRVGGRTQSRLACSFALGMAGSSGDPLGGGRPPIVDTIRSHSAVWRSFDTKETLQDQRLCAVLSDFMKRSSLRLVRGLGGRPVLFSYGADGTPMHVRSHYVAKLGPHTKVRRSGGSGCEFLMQNAFFRTTDALGRPMAKALLEPPVPMTEGKTAWNYFVAATRFFPHCGDAGHGQGIKIAHYTFDRAIFASVLRKLKGHHALVLERQAQGKGPMEAEILRWCDWVVGTGCACHDTHNSLAWGLKPHLSNPDEDLKDVFAVIAGLRGGYGQLVQHLPEFLRRHVRFSDACPGEAVLAEVWQALGVVPEDGCCGTYPTIGIGRFCWLSVVGMI